METILLFLPTFFIFFTGMLISWGIYLMVVMVCKSEKDTSQDKKIIKKICLFGILVITTFLAGNLFIFTAFAAFHMPTILFLEIWYSTFLYRITVSPWSTPCQQLIDKFTIRKKPQTIQQ